MNDDRPSGAARPGPAEAPSDAGPATEDPPPLTAFAWRNRLVRPVEGRFLAGVCGAFGRATNTDPILWRVLIAVLSVFGGIGVLAYLLGWLLLPADGDTASPVEALAGRGRSGTSPVMTVIGSVVVLLSLGVTFSEPFRPGPWSVILLGGALLLLLRDRRSQVRTAAPVGPGGAAASMAVAPMSGAPMWSAPSGGAAPVPAGRPMPPSGLAAPPSPFASPGPYEPGDAGYPPGPPPTPPPGRWTPTPPPPPPRPKPSRPKSRLGRLTISMAMLVIGGVGILDLTGFSVPAAGYVAAALTTVGLGLVVGAWFGRARGLVAVGIVLGVVLSIVGIVDSTDSRWWRGGGSMTWAPASIAQLRDSYSHGAGEARLDLTAIDFALVANPVSVDVTLGLGNLMIIVPPNVDVTITAHVDAAGNADVFRESWNGLGMDSRTVTDAGADGPGGGELRINASVTAGNLEVHR